MKLELFAPTLLSWGPHSVSIVDPLNQFSNETSDLKISKCLPEGNQINSQMGTECEDHRSKFPIDTIYWGYKYR